MDSTLDFIEKKRKKNEELKLSGLNLYPNDFKVSHTVTEILDGIDENTGETQETVYYIAGRMMAVNKFGKSSFIRIKDRTGLIQAYIRKDKIGSENYDIFKKLDIGDIVGVHGTLFKTKTGEWTVLAEACRLLSKSTRALPEKFHGLKDPEKRYRQRYVDLIVNDTVKDIFITRSRIVQIIRNYLLEKEFLEVETPMMQPMAGGAVAAPFTTHHNALNMELYLRIAPELYLKRLVVGGFERVFEINRNFRNEGISTKHNPEFTMLEFYQAYATYNDLMDMTEDLFKKIAIDLNGTTSIDYQGDSIDFGKKWKRISMISSLTEIGGIDSSIIYDHQALIDFSKSRGIDIKKDERYGKTVEKLFDEFVEPKLIQPTFITDYPSVLSPLSRKSDSNPDITERFELFIAGREIANAFSELNDPVDQKDRFLMQLEDREKGDEEAHQMDDDYIEALEYGLPPTAGEGIGIDRVVMLFTDSASIREVILFPLMRQLPKK